MLIVSNQLEPCGLFKIHKILEIILNLSPKDVTRFSSTIWLSLAPGARCHHRRTARLPRVVRWGHGCCVVDTACAAASCLSAGRTREVTRIRVGFKMVQDHSGVACPKWSNIPRRSSLGPSSAATWFLQRNRDD